MNGRVRQRRETQTFDREWGPRLGRATPPDANVHSAIPLREQIHQPVPLRVILRVYVRQLRARLGATTATTTVVVLLEHPLD